MNNICPETQVPTMPFLFRSKDHMRALNIPVSDQGFPEHWLAQVPVPDRSMALLVLAGEPAADGPWCGQGRTLRSAGAACGRCCRQELRVHASKIALGSYVPAVKMGITLL